MRDRGTGTADGARADRHRERRVGDGQSLRQSVLECLRRADEPLPLGAVASRIVARRIDAETDTPPSSRVQRVYLELVRYEVPALERRGVVEYSSDDGTLELVGPGTP